MGVEIVRGPLVTWSALGRKLSITCSIPRHFSPGVLGGHPHHLYCFGTGCQTKVALLLRMASFHLLAGIHPTTFLHCHPPLLWVFYPISKSFCVWHPPKDGHTGERDIGALAIFHPSSITEGWVTSLRSKHESLPPQGRSVGRDKRVLKKHFGARPRETPGASSP